MFHPGNGETIEGQNVRFVAGLSVYDDWSNDQCAVDPSTAKVVLDGSAYKLNCGSVADKNVTYMESDKNNTIISIELIT